jgi:hypothetical protein
MAFLCVSQQGEFKNTINTLSKKSTSKPLCKKVGGKKLVSLRFFYRVFGRFLATASSIKKPHIFQGVACAELAQWGRPRRSYHTPFGHGAWEAAPWSKSDFCLFF